MGINLVFVDDLSHVYTECDEHEYNLFAVVDESSLKVGTLLLVNEPEKAGRGQAALTRVVLEMAETQLALWVADKTTIHEGREEAQNNDNSVLRTGMDM